MTSTLEQCETKSLGPLSSTLEIFDTFKSREEDKDSDEESFHLPLLGCDDDTESKEDALGTSTPNAETEDDILNKFETISTPEVIDEKVEVVVLLTEDDKTSIKKNDDEAKEKGCKINMDGTIDQNKKESDSENYGMFNDLEIVDEADESFEEIPSDDINTDKVQNEPDEANQGQKEEENMGNEDKKDENDITESKEPSKEEPIRDNKEPAEIDLKNNKNSEDLENIETKTDDILKNEDCDLLSTTNVSTTVNENMETEDMTEKVDADKEVTSDAADTVNENMETEDIVEEVEDDKIVISDTVDPVNEICEDEEIILNNAHTIQEDTEILEDDNENDVINDIVQEVNEKLSNEEIDPLDDDKLCNESEKKNLLDEADHNSPEENNILDVEKTSDVRQLNKELENNSEDQPKDNEVEFMEIEDTEDILKDNILDPISGDNAPLEDTLKETEKPEQQTDENKEQICDTTINNECSVMDVDPLGDTIAEDDKPIEENTNINKDKDEGKKAEDEDKQAEDEDKQAEDEDKQAEDEEKQAEEKSEEDKLIEDTSGETKAAAEEIKMISQDNTESNEKDKPENNELYETESKETQLDKDIECDDLLAIAIIRDADEDNASAIAEITGTHSSDKSDNDDQDDKQDDTDEIEADQEDNLLSSDKDDHMESDDGNTCDQDTSTTDNIISEHTNDGENKENEVIQSESDSQNVLSVDDITEITSNQSSVDTENKIEEQVSEKASVTDQTVTSNEELESTKSAQKTTEELKESGKRPLSDEDSEALPVANKKMRLSEEFSKGSKKSGEEKKKLSEEKKKSIEEKKKSIEEKKKLIEEKKKANSVKNDKIKTLITFEKFMKNRNLGDGKLTRSDLEQFCLQKICEALVHKTETGELHQTVKKQEQIIDNLRKDLQQLSKQTRDLDIVNKKLMNELRAQNGNQKPLVPLKITRSVGLQVKLNIGSEPVTRRKPYTATTTTSRIPTTPNTPTTPVNRPRNIQAASSVIRQVAPATRTTASPCKTPAVAPILTQALQTRPTPALATATPPTPATKRITTIRAKPAEPQKPPAPGVIDLTDEDDRTAQTTKTVANNVQQKTIPNKTMGTPMKILNKNVNLAQNKNVGPKGNNQKVNNAQSKTVAVGQVKQVGPKVNMQPRAVTTMPQGVRLTSAQMKNGIAIPASVVTSSAGGTTQLMYVVQPTGASGNSGSGVQKAVLLNFQPTNGVLTSALNGSTVSVIPSKGANTMQLKTIAAPRKHPAPLPLPPPAIVNTSLKPLLPKPHLSIRKTDTGIILQWRMPYNLDIYEGIASYQLFAYQETNAPPSTDMWRKVGDVKALALPMACTLTQFADKNKYYFAVRSVDVHKRIGAFSDPEEISL